MKKLLLHLQPWYIFWAYIYNPARIGPPKSVILPYCIENRCENNLGKKDTFFVFFAKKPQIPPQKTPKYPKFRPQKVIKKKWIKICSKIEQKLKKNQNLIKIWSKIDQKLKKKSKINQNLIKNWSKIEQKVNQLKF